MTLRLPILTALGFALAFACGGESLRRTDSDSGEDAGADSGGTTTGGATAGGTTSGGAVAGGTGGTTTGGASSFGGALTGGTTGASGGSAGSAGSDDCSNLPPSGYIGNCVRDCGTDPNDFTSPVCVSGAFVCPTGTVQARACPGESCARRNDWECCQHVNGTVEPMRCSADGGGTLPCIPGTEQQERGASCVPDGVDVATCVELEGQPCTDASLECHQGAGCGDTTCRCYPGPENIDRFWSCQVVLCVP